MSPDATWVPTGTTADAPRWRHVAQRYAESLAETPSARQWLRLADLWDRGDRPPRAEEAARQATEQVRAMGGHIQMVAVTAGVIDWLVPAGDWFVVSRRVDLHGAMPEEVESLYRIELWSPEDHDRPMWAEYAFQAQRHAAMQRLEWAGLTSQQGIDPTAPPDWASVPGVYARVAEDPKFIEVVERGVVRQTLEITGEETSPARVYDTSGSGCRTVWMTTHDYALAVATSPDGQYVAALADDNTVRLFDLSRGTSHELSLAEHALPPYGTDERWEREPQALAFSTASDELMVLFDGSDLVSWSTADARPSSQVAPPCAPDDRDCRGVRDAAFSPGLRRLAVVTDHGIRVHEVGRVEPVTTVLAQKPRWLQFVDDDRFIYLSDAREVHRWSMDGGDEIVATSQATSFARTPRMIGGRVDIPFEPDAGDGTWARWDMATRKARLIANPLGDREGFHLHDTLRTTLVESDGILEIKGRQGDPIASVVGLADGGWVAISASGAVDGTVNAPDALVAIVDTGEETFVARPHHLMSELLVPGVVHAALRGVDVAP